MSRYTEFAKVRLPDDAFEGFVESLVAEVARERGRQLCLTVSSGDGVDDSFEGGVCCGLGLGMASTTASTTRKSFK